ncbi:KIF-binding protein-like isoform X2 [Rhodnius prolixus]
MISGNYFDWERGTLVPNTLKVLQERHEEFKAACQVIELKAEKNPKKWWTGSLAKAKADSLLTHLDHILLSLDTNQVNFPRYIAMKACVFYEAGTYLLNKYVNSAMQLLRKAHELLWPLLPKSEVYWLYFFTVNNLAKAMKEKDYELGAIQLLEESIQIYDRKEMPKIMCTCKDLFSQYFKIQPNKDSKKHLENIVTDNFQILVNLYILKCETKKYLKSEHFLLRRELDLNMVVSYDWIERAAVVAKILIMEHDFRNARHHLAIATTQFYKMKGSATGKKEDKARIQTLEEALSTAWIRYGSTLLNSSKQAIMNRYSSGDQVTYPVPSLSTTKKNNDNYLDDEDQSNDKLSLVDDVKLLMENVKSEYSMNLLPEVMRLSEGDSSDQLQEDPPSEHDTASSATIIDQTLFLYPQDTLAEKLSDALEKDYVDLRFPGQNNNEIEQKIPRYLVEKPMEAADLFIFLLPWIDVFKKIVDNSTNPTQYASSILELNELLKTFAFFQPEPKQQYELHKERQTELERLAWLLRQDENVNSLTTELEVTRELSLVHYLLTHMNLKRMKELEEEEEAIKSNNADLVQEMLEKTTI